MNKTLKTYDELLTYQQELRNAMVIHRGVIREDIKRIKAEFSPLTNVVRFGSKFFVKNKDHSAVVNGVGTLVDIAIRRILLPRAGWISRMIIPFFAKNISSHFVANHKIDLLTKVASLLTPRKKKKFAEE